MREWEVLVKQGKCRIEKHSSTTLVGACFRILKILEVLNALHCYNKGDFVETSAIGSDKIVVKRYVIVLQCPLTTITLKKRSKGSLNTEEVLNTLKLIKEDYFARI